MKQVLVISGKGGTGKTSLTAALAHLLKPLVLADCDVDAADLHLLAGAEDAEPVSEPFDSGLLPALYEKMCNGCALCATFCRFDAIEMIDRPGAWLARIDELKCEGCGVCIDHCPHGALRERKRRAGSLEVLATRFGPLVQGRLYPGQPNSGKLVVAVRARAEQLAKEQGAELVLVDGPPGVGCPVIAALGGIDLALLIAEPSATSQHDLERALQLCERFKVPPAVVLNKADLHADSAQSITELCAAEEVELAGRIDYDEAFLHALADGRTIVEAAPKSPAARSLQALSERLGELLS